MADPIQATLVDFGHYTAEPDYTGHHLLTLVHDRPLNWGSFLRDSDPGWVRDGLLQQPDFAAEIDDFAMRAGSSPGRRKPPDLCAPKPMVVNRIGLCKVSQSVARVGATSPENLHR
ncbi:MAG: hypothetical protein WBH04_09410 [Albidovulum sp.]